MKNFWFNISITLMTIHMLFNSASAQTKTAQANRAVTNSALTHTAQGHSTQATSRELAQQQQQQTLCSVTLNSDNEINLFKSQLDPQKWNFIELTLLGNNGSSDPSLNDKTWFQEIARQNIQCDIVLISAHFGGTFFGMGINKQLTLDQLELASCDNRYDGFFKKPQEVFLLGCNTLAEKNQDGRSPEEYYSVLREDGFTALQASQTVSLRYSQFGISFRERMQSVFDQVPRLYGFTARGPSGKTIEPYLKRYFYQTRDFYNDGFQNNSQSLFIKDNQSLISSLSKTKFIQSPGAKYDSKISNNKYYCSLAKNLNDRSTQIALVENLLEQQESLGLLQHIHAFMQKLLPRGLAETNHLSATEKIALNRLSRNQKIKQALLQIVNEPNDSYLPLKVKILETLQDIGQIKDYEKQTQFNQLVDLQKPFDQFRQDTICSSNFQTNTRYSDIPASRWQESHFLNALMCLRPTDARIFQKLVSIIESRQDDVMRTTAIWSFQLHNYAFFNYDVLKRFIFVLQTEQTDYVRQSLVSVMRSALKAPQSPIYRNTLSPEQIQFIKMQILKKMASEKNQTLIELYSDFVSEI